ncbi:MAG: energy transducer TonB [Novosphingobium sp.]
MSARPRFITGKQPDDLPEALAVTGKGQFGKVLASATVLPTGSLTDITLDQPSGVAALDAAIIAALETWRLSAPVDKAGNKVATRAKFPFTIGRGPRRLSGTEAAMPQAAIVGFHNGKVVVGFRIDPEGVPVDLKVVRSSKSDLLDNALLTSVAASRFEKPIDLQGRPASYDTQVAQNFSQAEHGGGSYITGLKSYRCDTFIGELDWWSAAHPGAKPSELEFYSFMGGVSFIAPEALGWGKLENMSLLKRHPVAWDHAVEACRNEPGSRFLEQYRKG